MPLLFPTQGTLHDMFAAHSPISRQSVLPTVPAAPGNGLFPAWSTADDVKAKAAALGTGAQKEYQKASAAAQAKAGTIELYSAKYYAACTLGGLLACVSLVVSNAGVKGY